MSVALSNSLVPTQEGAAPKEERMTTTKEVGDTTRTPAQHREVHFTPLRNGEAATVSIGGDLVVGRIGYGAMQLTGPKVWGAYPDHDRGVAVLQEVVRTGVTFIDTADVYGPHSNEELIREALY